MKRIALVIALVLAAPLGLLVGSAAGSHEGPDFWLHCLGAPLTCNEEPVPTVTDTVTTTVTVEPPPTITEPPPPTTPDPSEADFWVAANGSDSNPGTEAQPFKTLSKGYAAASLGDFVLVKCGTFSTKQSIALGTLKGDPNAILSRVVFKPVTNAIGCAIFPEGIEVLAPHIEIHRMSVPNDTIIARYRSDNSSQRAGNLHLIENDVGKLQMNSVHNFLIARNDVGPRADSDGIDIYAWPPDDGHHPKNGIIEDNLVHDHTLSPGSSEHVDALQFTAGENIIVRRNTFRNYHHQGILAKTDQGPILNLVIENNWFDDPVDPGFSLMFMQTSRPCSNHVVAYNTFLRAPTSRAVDAEMCGGANHMYANVWPSMSSTNCSGWTDNTWVLAYNLSASGACGANASTGTDVRGKGDPARCFPLDIERKTRPNPAGSVCDAGAYEQS